jgi:3-oxoacyl-[acyl-carrier-protein] synthase I
MRTAEYFRDGTQYQSVVAQCGDVGAATGAFGFVQAAEAWRVGKAQSDLAFVWAGSWAGLRGAAVLAKGNP